MQHKHPLYFIECAVKTYNRTLSVFSLATMPLDFDRLCSVNVSVSKNWSITLYESLKKKRDLKNWYNIHSYGG